MTKEQQTPEVITHLYNLTKKFVYKYKFHYYKQYRGDLDDLATEFFIQFLTPKSRIKGKEQSLLDKYNPEVTSLEYLTKVSVIRMLIDRSRKDKSAVKSIDYFVDEYGDLITMAFDLVEEPENEKSFELSVPLKHAIVNRFLNSSYIARQRFVDAYNEIKSDLSLSSKQFLNQLFGILHTKIVVQTEFDLVECPIYQITDKTICLFIDGDIVNFNKENGKCRSNDTMFIIPLDLKKVNNYIIKPVAQREEFISQWSQALAF